MKHYKRRRYKRRLRSWIRRLAIVGALLSLVLFGAAATVGTGFSVLDNSASAVVAGAQDAFEDEPLNRSEIERAVHYYVNQERQAHGRAPIEFDNQLREVARFHSEDMASKDYFSHDSPSGEEASDRYAQFGIDCGDKAENIAWTVADGDVRTETGTVDYDRNETRIGAGLVRQWMNSPRHREILLDGSWQSEGIGIALTESDNGTRVYATQNFC